MDEDECFELLRELVTSARQGNNKRYVHTRKVIMKAIKEDFKAKHFFRTATRAINGMEALDPKEHADSGWHWPKEKGC